MLYHSSRLVITLLLGLLILLPVGIKGAGEDVITAEDLIEQVRILAAPEMEGRASGRSGGTRAAAHIAEEFRRIELQPLGDRGDYLQLFEVATGVRLGTRNRLALDLAAGRKEYQVGGYVPALQLLGRGASERRWGVCRLWDHGAGAQL